jgi:recombinational DNA repair ATPase RecF
MAENSEQSVHEVILQMLDEDANVDPAVKEAVLQALVEVEDDATSVETDSAPTFLSSISVAGFRGIGRQARLDLYPAPGLMVVSGRNGSGKSSFAEALELALTGTSYRWHKKETLWAESWQNLHHHDPCAIRIDFAVEASEPLTIGVDWAPDATLTERTSWTQVGSGKRVDSIEGLGWGRPLELWRPVLSYDELGRLFDGGPSALYDALAKLLGLEALADAEKWLTTGLKSNKETRTRADEERKQLTARLAESESESEDERAQRAIAILKKRPVPLDGVLAVATGADDTAIKTAPALRALTRLQPPAVDEIRAAAARLRDTGQKAAEAATVVADSTRHRVDLLQAALRFHEHVGDGECPVCGQGRLDSEWAAEARGSIASTEATLAEYHTAAAELKQATSAATGLVAALAEAPGVPGVGLAALPPYNEAVAAARNLPADLARLAAHLDTTMVAVAEAADTLRAEAVDAMRARESAWGPLAAQLAAWVRLEEAARNLDGTVKTMTAAKKWITDHGARFRNLRLEPVAGQARNIWAALRQESNVDLGDITLEGTGTRRRAVLGGAVDGEPTKALSVMSQGELHALALALFLPRATAANSPFRFVILDDPIQAMDPAKIDGLVKVLSEIARTHQVIVFSHDDRLASVIRETGVDARLVEVVREIESRVTVRDNVNPAMRQVDDVFAIIKDERLSDDVKAKVLPGLFRMALESAGRQAYFTKQALAGRARVDFEAQWLSVRKTRPRLALTVLGDSSADISAWINAKPARRRTVQLCNAVHGGAEVAIEDARDLERTVTEVLALR